MKKCREQTLFIILMIPFLVWLGCNGSSPPETGDDAVDRWVLQWMEDRSIPGLSLAVIHRGEPVKIRGYGLCSLELDAPASASTVYPLASVTKSFTGAAVMLLMQEQKLSLEDPIDQHLEGLPEHWRFMHQLRGHLFTLTAEGLISVIRNVSITFPIGVVEFLPAILQSWSFLYDNYQHLLYLVI